LKLTAALDRLLSMLINTHPALQVIDRWLKYQIAQGDIPGFQVSIRKSGQLIFSKAYGYSDIKSKTKYTKSHTGRIASQSKVFTAALALWLNSQSQLNLNAFLVNVLPEFKSHKDPNFKKIKLIDLLSHRSGIYRDSFDHNYWADKQAFLSNIDLIDCVLAHSLIYKPGECTKYSNIGFALLGLALERATGESFTDLMKTFFKYTKINTKISIDYNGNNNLSQGFIRRQMRGQNFTATPHRATKAFAPAAGFCANTESTTEFLHRLYLTDNILPKSQRLSLLKKKWPVMNMSSDYYGLGTMFCEVNKKLFIGHGGGFPGFSSQTWVEPKSKYTFGFITNTSVIKTFSIIRSMAEIIQAIDENFKGTDLKSLKITQPMADNFASSIYVVGKSKALVFPLTGFLPTEDLMVFHRKKDYYLSDKINGYKNVGEPLTFSYKSGKIIAVKMGGFKLQPAT
jgi:D-alanyl-D-alanine carboxypeptidase